MVPKYSSTEENQQIYIAHFCDINLFNPLTTSV